MRSGIILFSFAAVLLILSSCLKQNAKCDASLSYENGIKTIIDGNCLTSGCHNTNSVNGDFTTYAGLVRVIDSGRFRTKVMDEKSMPKGKKLKKSELHDITCWIDNGYPEK